MEKALTVLHRFETSVNVRKKIAQDLGKKGMATRKDIRSWMEAKLKEAGDSYQEPAVEAPVEPTTTEPAVAQ